MSDLIAYLPEIYHGIREFRAVCQAENPERDIIWDSLEEIMDDQFAGSLRETGCSRWEGMLNLESGQGEELSARRLRILARLNEQLPFTRKALKSMLDLLCGKGLYQLTIQEGDYFVEVAIALEVKGCAPEVGDLLERVLPCNLTLSVTFIWNTHRVLSAFTHRQLSAYTQRELREEVVKWPREP